MILRRVGWVILLVVMPGVVAAGTPVEPFLKVEHQPGGVTALRVAIRELVPTDPRPGEPARPVIWLVGAIHIGEPAYYDAVQKVLDQQSVVLFEAVGRPSFADTTPATNAVRAMRTRQALRFAGGMALWYRQQFSSPPRSLELLREAARDRHRRESLWLHAALHDGWGRPLIYRLDPASPDGFVLRSLGADGEPGGTGPAADLAFDQLPGTRWVPGHEAGLQGEFAAALGLVFQLDAIDYSRPNFRHADLSLARLQHILNGQVESPTADDDDQLPAAPHAAAHPNHASHNPASRQMNQLMGLLEGTSTSAALMRVGLRFVGASPSLRAVVKLMMAETLGSVGGDIAALKMPEEMRQLMKVLIVDRNRVVMQKLRETLAEQPPPRSVAIFFGAAHMPDLQRQITQSLGYRVGSERWLTAFSASARDAGLNDFQLQALRSMIQQQMRSLEPK